MARLVTDAEAKIAVEAEAPTEVWGVPVPEGEWVGPGAVEELGDGRGDDDDCERARD